MTKLTPEKWAAADAAHHYGVEFDVATPEQRKRATYDFLERHMCGVMREREVA